VDDGWGGREGRVRLRGVAAALVAVLLPSIFRGLGFVSVVVFSHNVPEQLPSQDAGIKSNTFLSSSFAA
jgi:hypothetical protein